MPGLAEPLVTHAADLRALRSLARATTTSRANRRAIVDANGPHVFVAALLRSENAQGEAEEHLVSHTLSNDLGCCCIALKTDYQGIVAQIIAGIAADTTHAAAFVSANAVPALFDQLRSARTCAALSCANALAHLALSGTFLVLMAEKQC